MTFMLVALGGAVGATVRYLVDQWLQADRPVWLPWGTLTVNVAGSGVLGALSGVSAARPGWVWPLVAVGWCGALTTYSTFGFETLRLARQGRLLAAVANVTLSLVLGVSAAAVGWFLAS
ncbi:fluoride efflux transporter CrcB [Pilimelia columellifera]|uniref:Fluoride-specific ion channel FluC n=1 Tax=Pilimelia columellifera subsp. columellifera TaxID=706583 RepID=A0ABN3N0Z5_9ACTN